MTTPFTATKWNSIEDKTKFVKQLKMFVEKDFPETAFTKTFYNRMSMMRGHIAHYDRNGFFATWFDTSKRKADFLRHWTMGVIYGDPAYTWSDVETVIQKWLQQHPEHEERQRQQHYAIIEDIERKELRRLSEKYA